MTVEERMQLIQKHFQEGKELAATENSIENLATLIDKYPLETRSIITEGASMQAALKSLQEKDSLSGWLSFYSKIGVKFSSQAHVGVGWALAELNLSINPYTSLIDRENHWRILDGYGYYFALFKRRIVLRQQEFPSQLSKNQEGFYTQGIGRCLWYLAKGDVSKLESTINILKTPFLSDLWRGIGIAVSYIGLINDAELEHLKTLAKDHVTSFLCGTLIAASSSVKSGCNTSESIDIVKRLFIDSDLLIKQLITFEQEHKGEGFYAFKKTLLLH